MPPPNRHPPWGHPDPLQPNHPVTERTPGKAAHCEPKPRLIEADFGAIRAAPDCVKSYAHADPTGYWGLPPKADHGSEHNAPIVVGHTPTRALPTSWTAAGTGGSWPPNPTAHCPWPTAATGFLPDHPDDGPATTID